MPMLIGLFLAIANGIILVLALINGTQLAIFAATLGVVFGLLSIVLSKIYE